MPKLPALVTPTSEQVHPDEAASSKGKFTCPNDIALLEQVNTTMPWEAGHGGVMSVWAKIAANLSESY
ncbi:hypothetical protein AeNC1_015360, partial [Aphanomyces euteiches]